MASKQHIRPYGDRRDDGVVQLSFTLPVPLSEKAKEAALLSTTEVKVVSTVDVRDGRPLEAAVGRLAASCSLLYLHVDLDVLDPRLVPSSSTPAEKGLEIAEAARAAATVFRTGKVAAFPVTSLNPGAGARGERSTKSALAFLEQALAAWERVPGPPAADGA